MREVGKRVRKKDAMALVTGQPVYTDDLAPKECLIVKVLRSPHANAIVEEVNKTVALKVPGVEAIYTWEDVPKERFAQAGQTYPEWSPYDRLILDRHVRFVGDPVAIVAGENEACVDRALKMLKVKYKVLPAVLDYHTAKDNETLVHPRTAGNPCIRLAQTISEIYVPTWRKKREMWKVRLKTVISYWNTLIMFRQ